MNGVVFGQMQLSITHLSGSVDSLKLEQSERKLCGVNFMCPTVVLGLKWEAYYLLCEDAL